MKTVRIPWHSWVAVCDGSKAMFLRNEGDTELLNLKLMEVFEHPQSPSRELGTDRPGRVFQSKGVTRSAVEAADLHNDAEIAFFRKVADLLDDLVQRNSVTSLVMVAPPKALGVLRQQLAPTVHAVITAEIAKDLVPLPIKEIEKHLTN